MVHPVSGVTEIAQQLIRYPTVNPPGDEREAMCWIQTLLAEAGIEARLIGVDPQRPNLVARVAGQGRAPTLLFQGHLDVVPVADQDWTQDPFAGVVHSGELWGRGAVDMKGQLAMMLAAVLELAAAGERPAGDVLLVVLADEENGSRVGARYLAAEHRELFADVGYAIGEDGGAELHLAPATLHPVVVAEKRTCWLRVTLAGPSGHASRPPPTQGASHKLHRLLGALADETPHDVRVEPVIDTMLRMLSSAVAGPWQDALDAFRATPHDTRVLAGLDARTRNYLHALVRHTITPTVFRGGSATNVIPPSITVDLDCRLLPGPFDADEFIADLRRRVGTAMDVEVLVEGEPAPTPTLGPVYDTLASVLAAEDPGGVPVPLVTPASTDARVFRAMGIECFGWFPMLQDTGAVYRDLLHCADERVSVRALEFGARCHRRLLKLPA